MPFKNSEPIYQQIIDDFKKQIIRSELRQGDRIPSQREFAGQVQVNPNTVQRAYREMESMGIVETVRGQGTFVVADEAMREKFRKDMADNILQYFITEMQSLGYRKEEIQAMLIRAMAGVGEDEK